MSRKIIGSAALILLLSSTAAPALGDVGQRLRDLADSYYDLFGNYPRSYSCELRSPELVASLEPKARQAWGDGHILLTKAGPSLRLTAEDVAQPEAAPLFNIALGLWQVKLGTELQVLQAQLPSFLLATVLGALTRYQGFEERQGDHLRFGLRARGAAEKIREVSFLVDDRSAIRELEVRNLDGSSLVATVANVRTPGSSQWLISAIDAEITRADGAVEVFSAELGYTSVEGRVMFDRIALEVRDGEGRPVQRNPRDVNPISYRFTDCRLPATE